MSVELEKAGFERTQLISNIANMSPIYCEEDDKIKSAIKKFLDYGHRSMPVVSRKKDLVGIVTVADILDTFLRNENLDDKISSIMTRDVIFCRSSDSLHTTLLKFKLSRRGRFPVISESKLVGIISEYDFIKNFASHNFGVAIDQIMTKKPFFLSPQTSIKTAIKSIVSTKYRRLPIVANGGIIGVISALDLLKFLAISRFDSTYLGSPVSSVISNEPVTIEKKSDISEAIKKMKEKKIDFLSVVNSKFEGIVTERDILEEIV